MSPLQEKSRLEKLLHLANKISVSKIQNSKWVAQQYTDIYKFLEERKGNSEET